MYLVSLCQQPPDLAPHVGPELVAWRSLCHRGGHHQSCETISKVSLLTLHDPLITLHRHTGKIRNKLF